MRRTSVSTMTPKEIARRAFMAGAKAESAASFDSVMVHIGDEDRVEMAKRRGVAFLEWFEASVFARGGR